MTENEEKRLNVAIVGGGRSQGKTLREHIELLEELEQYRAIGTVRQVQDFIADWRKYRAFGTLEELQALKENQRKCEDCAGCTTWKCDCSNIRNKAIDDFLTKICIKYTEEEGKGNYRQYCASIKQGIADIAEAMKEGDSDA